MYKERSVLSDMKKKERKIERKREKDSKKQACA